jgi:hypothetical protein
LSNHSFFDTIRKALRKETTAPEDNNLLARKSVKLARGFANFHTSDHWNLWAEPNFLEQYSGTLTNELVIFPELFVKQIEIDFGYTIFPLRGDSYDGAHLDLVLDPASQGGARTGSLFGPLGVSLSPDSVYNDYNGEFGFWFRVLSLHETVNVWTGRLAGGWIWADGSPLWQGKSPFPNMADFAILEEIGYKKTARSQRARITDDPYVRLFHEMQQKFGWRVFQGLFSMVKEHGISDWHAFGEPLRTAITILFLSRAAGTDLLEGFQRAGIAVSQENYARAESIFPE